MSSDHVLYEIDGAVASIKLNRPERRNALTDAMFERISSLIRQAGDDDTVKAVVLAAEGASFSSGFDLSEPDDFYGGAEGMGSRFAVAKLRKRAEWMRDLLYSPKPVIARVQGHCIGAGLYLVLVSNFAIVSDDASFGLPEERFGSSGTSWLYPFIASQCGLKVANELLMTGRRFDADEAYQLRLVNRVVDTADLDDEVSELARAVSSLPRDGIAVSRALAHLTYDILGIAQSFTPHYAVHPLVVSMQRGSDEFDFREVVRERGLKAALSERDALFAGRYWGW